MRLLVGCSECHRRYDASQLKPGSRTRCHCGAVIEVEAPRGHQANVVRCSSCGAPREKGTAKCAHCHNDFTLREQDLDTVCPTCTTRVSDHAHYCHVCGNQLFAEPLVGDTSQLPCPACDSHPAMRSRVLTQQDVSLMECNRCAGMWLSNSSFEQLTERAALKALPHTRAHKTSPRVRLPGLQQETGTGWRYRKCPVCEKLMVRRHYGKGSGVIIDMCRQHGIWLDAQELPTILAWIRAGGKQWLAARAARDAKQRQQAALRERRSEHAKRFPDPFPGRRGRRAERAIDTLCRLFSL